MPDWLTTTFELLGVAAIVGGFWAIWWPIAVVLLGIMLLCIGYFGGR